MKTSFVILLLAISLSGFCQSKDSTRAKVPLSKGESLTVKEYNEYLKKVTPILLDKVKRDSTFIQFIRVTLQANEVPLNRVSFRGDSLKLVEATKTTPASIDVILKKYKPKK